MSLDWFNIQNQHTMDERAVSVFIALAGWLVLTLATLLILSLFTMENFFIVSFIGLLVIMQVFGPVRSRPQWWVVLRWIKNIGLVVFALIMLSRISAVVNIV